CTGWASSFAARTISESIETNRTNQIQSSDNAFSPLDAYLGFYSFSNRIPRGYETESFLRILDYLKSIRQEGAQVPDVLDYLKTTGAVKRNEAERTNLHLIFRASYLNLRRFPISDYVRLFSNRFGVPGTIEERVLPVKKSLSERKPVIIAMVTPLSFHNRGTDVFRPYESPSSGTHGAHAMCVVGYDDNRHGGAFEVQNSWGTNWGNGGYIWIPYGVFANFVFEAYEIIENLSLYGESTRFAANIDIEVFNSREGMPVTFDRQGFYKTNLSYPSGTEFRFLMTNRFPSYVYAFAADSSTQNISRIFPLAGVSPVMDYLDSTIAWPGEREWIQMDETVGTDYLIVLFSKEALDINAIQRRFANERGAFVQRVSRAVGQNFIPYNNVQYNNNKIEFSAETHNPRSVFGLLLAIDHRAR
ncbi:MAG: C1 family peptidase, partial [Treponema sp.]|nr:C1 family peptidase [Treponema sp.]MCL2237989.1 C1 family peptidase [Treponema sp.]